MTFDEFWNTVQDCCHNCKESCSADCVKCKAKRAWEAATKCCTAKNYYIRFGEIPKDGHSGIYQNGLAVGKEIGVSCYDADVDFQNKEVRVKLNLSNMNDTYVYYLAESAIQGYKYLRNPKAIAYQKEHPREPTDAGDNKYKPIKTDFHVYLVTGRKVGIGSSNEPVLENVRIVKTLYIRKMTTSLVGYVLTYEWKAINSNNKIKTRSRQNERHEL